MKRIILLVGLLFSLTTIYAQNSYIVKTRGYKKAVTTNSDGSESSDASEPEDFVATNFKYYSLCDWKEGMKFMVMPEKYDMIVNTFSDASTNKEVSNGSLREKIMVYKGHSQTADGRCHINFTCEDNNKNYYYEVPNGTFEDYCGDKMGVPTLAYLGDVDIARNNLMGAKLYTKTNVYRVDDETSANGYTEVSVSLNTPVTVVAIGAGTRSFPVKIIVEDANKKQFYQCVAMSRTNSGMRDEEFVNTDNTKFLFNNSFERVDVTDAVTGSYSSYVNSRVYTKRSTKMEGPRGIVTIRRNSEFVIKAVRAQSNTTYVILTLRSVNDGRTYTKQVTFVNTDNVAGDIDGFHEDYFPELFGRGSIRGAHKGISNAHWKAISAGRVLKGMTKSEVRLAKGDPASSYDESKGGTTVWLYSDKTIVKFNKAGRVSGL